MSDKRKHIDDYFANSLEEQIEESLDLDLNWKAMESKLDKFSFFKFQMNRFNVYYFGLVCMMIATFLFVKLNGEKKSAALLIPSVASDSSAIIHTVETEEYKGKSSPINFSKKSVVNKEMVKNESISLPTAIDSSNAENEQTIKSAPLIVNEAEKKTDSLAKPKIKPPVVINRKRDTIIKVDTIFTNKRKRN